MLDSKTWLPKHKGPIVPLKDDIYIFRVGSDEMGVLKDLEFRHSYPKFKNSTTEERLDALVRLLFRSAVDEELIEEGDDDVPWIGDAEEEEEEEYKWA